MEKIFKHGFTVILAQPFHLGHHRLIKDILARCEYGTVVIGSANETGTAKNPFPYHVRKKMIQNIYSGTEDYNRLWIVPVNDTDDIFQWPYNVIDAITAEKPEWGKPDVYFAGEQKNYQWFKSLVPNFILCDRTTQDFPFLSNSMVMEMISLGDIRWHEYVAPKNWELIEKTLNSKKRL